MTDTLADDFLTARPTVPVSERWPWRSMITALALEAILLGAATGWLAHSAVTARSPQTVVAPILLSMTEQTPVAAQAPVSQSAQPVRPPSVKHTVARKPDTLRKQVAAPPTDEPKPAEAPPIKTVSGADAPPAGVASPAPPTPAASAASNPDAGFAARMRAAVQAATVYPAALQGMGLEASIEVEFDYTDGHVSNVRVTKPGRVATLDQSAIAAVRRATMPLPPPELAGKTRTFRVRVNFSAA